MGEDYYYMHYYNGNDNILNLLSEQYGLLFCKKISIGYSRQDEIEYYDPVKRKYVTKVKLKRKNISLKFYYYNINKKDFNEIVIKDHKIYNKKYSSKFFEDNFIPVEKILDKIDIMYRIKKIEKIKKL
ncbi:MAG: hypothetical protein WDA02_07465 [Saccharofermentanales bacterium]